MKQKVSTAVSTMMIFLPWTIFILRQNEWALKSPGAEISIACYAVFMIFSGVFTILSYTKGEVKNTIMKLCVVINGVYALGGLIALGLMMQTKFF